MREKDTVKPSLKEMARALRAAGYRHRTFTDERFARWTIGDGVMVGKVRCTSWLSTEMAYEEMKKRVRQR